MEQIAINVANGGRCSARLGGLKRTSSYVGWGGVIMGAHGIAGACFSSVWIKFRMCCERSVNSVVSFANIRVRSWRTILRMGFLGYCLFVRS